MLVCSWFVVDLIVICSYIHTINCSCCRSCLCECCRHCRYRSGCHCDCGGLVCMCVCVAVCACVCVCARFGCNEMQSALLKPWPHINVWNPKMTGKEIWTWNFQQSAESTVSFWAAEGCKLGETLSLRFTATPAGSSNLFFVKNCCNYSCSWLAALLLPEGHTRFKFHWAEDSVHIQFFPRILKLGIGLARGGWGKIMDNIGQAFPQW